MHWARPNVDPVLGLRNILCSNRGKEDWKQIVYGLRQTQTLQRQSIHLKHQPVIQSRDPIKVIAIPIDPQPASPPPLQPPANSLEDPLPKSSIPAPTIHGAIPRLAKPSSGWPIILQKNDAHPGGFELLRDGQNCAIIATVTTGKSRHRLGLYYESIWLVTSLVHSKEDETASHLCLRYAFSNPISEGGSGYPVLPSREVGRHGLPTRLERRADPAHGAHLCHGGCLGCTDLR